MTRLIIAALGLALLSATAATAQAWKPDHGNLRPEPGTFGAHPRMPSMTPPKAPAPPAAPRYRPPQPEDGPFKPWKPTMRVDSARGGVDAYPTPKKPKGYIGPY